ncbi:MAG: hypothetical protein AABW47_04665 [Nanoarchaeota archaeon]
MIKDVKKGVIVYSVVVFFILIIVLGMFVIFFKKDFACSDGTKNNECSDVKPYYCLNENFINNASFCGCSSISTAEGNNCVSKYKTEARNITLNYTLRGEGGSIDFVVYKGIYDYLLKVPRYIDSSKNPTLLDFKLKNLDEESQEEFLFPLVVQIQEITKNKEDQARIAISLVQNIPFGYSNKSVYFSRTNKIDYQRYSYEVLYDLQGICSEKSGLLIFLLRKLGYGTAFIYYPVENHEATGIKCPISKSLINTEYCFIETTGPSIIGDSKTELTGIVELNSTPQVIIISNGTSFGKDMYEYPDVRNLIKIRENMRKYGAINQIQSNQFKDLKKKYGLIDFDSYTF